MIYLENCRLPDDQLSQMLETLINSEAKLREIYLVKMSLGPLTTKTILLLLKKKGSELQFSFRSTNFDNLY